LAPSTNSFIAFIWQDVSVRVGVTLHIDTVTDDIILGWKIVQLRALISHNADIFMCKTPVIYGECERNYDDTKGKVVPQRKFAMAYASSTP
jgi:hypothetical protein